jgi:hypothetical protein
MNKDNKNKEVDNTDKKLHISDVIDSNCGFDYGLDVEEHLRRYLQEQMEKSLGKPLGVDVIEEMRKRLRGEIE